MQDWVHARFTCLTGNWPPDHPYLVEGALLNLHVVCTKFSNTKIGMNVPRFVGACVIVGAVVDYAIKVQRNKRETASKDAMKLSRERTVFGPN